MQIYVSLCDNEPVTLETISILVAQGHEVTVGRRAPHCDDVTDQQADVFCSALRQAEQNLGLDEAA